MPEPLEVPGPSNEGVQLPKWHQDDRAKKENEKWGDDEALGAIKNKNDQRIHSVYGWIVAVFMILLSIVFAFSIISWAWHYLAPANCGWLEKEQFEKIQAILFSGSLGAILSHVIQKHFMN